VLRLAAHLWDQLRLQQQRTSACTNTSQSGSQRTVTVVLAGWYTDRCQRGAHCMQHSCLTNTLSAQNASDTKFTTSISCSYLVFQQALEVPAKEAAAAAAAVGWHTQSQLLRSCHETYSSWLVPAGLLGRHHNSHGCVPHWLLLHICWCTSLLSCSTLHQALHTKYSWVQADVKQPISHSCITHALRPRTCGPVGPLSPLSPLTPVGPAGPPGGPVSPCTAHGGAAMDMDTHCQARVAGSSCTRTYSHSLAKNVQDQSTTTQQE
jgi:hypothetical protein